MNKSYFRLIIESFTTREILSTNGLLSTYRIERKPQKAKFKIVYRGKHNLCVRGKNADQRFKVQFSVL